MLEAGQDELTTGALANRMWWDTALQTLQREFSDLADPTDITRLAVRLLLAMILGGILGYQRESVGAHAGLRTHMLVCVGCALFVLSGTNAGMQAEDLSRVLQGIASGIGFLGAGAIIKLTGEMEVRGLTTAAGIWLTAAVGVAVGMGQLATAVLSTLLALGILALLKITKRTRPDPEG